MRLDFADAMVEIVGQNPYCTSNYLAEVLNFCNAKIMGRFKEFGFQENVVTVYIPQTDLSHDHTYLTLPNGLIGFPLIKP